MAEAFLPEHPAIPGYEVVRRIARNGAIVYLARRTSSDEAVVLRVYNRGAHRPVDAQEALLAQLNHPNVLRIIEIGEVDHHIYVATESINATLAQKLRNGPLRIKEAVHLAYTIALTLDYIRAKGMVLVNLTPQSILLTSDMEPKLFDIQLTSAVEAWDTQRWVGEVRPAFNPPEALMDRSRVSPQGDTYRVGATLYAMLVGGAPFTGNAAEVVLAVVKRAPVSPRQMNSNISKQVEAVCLRCLDKEPEHRYASLQGLAADLARVSSLAGLEQRA